MTKPRGKTAHKGAKSTGSAESREGTPFPTRPSPRDDFYGYVNHTWLQDTSIPASESRWGVFDILRLGTANKLHKICEDSQGKRSRKGSNAQLVRDFYASGMDMEKRNTAGIRPLKEYLTEIENMHDRTDVTSQLAKLHLINAAPFFDINIFEDRKKAGDYALYLWQGGLGLPNKDYYLEDCMQDKRDAYKQYIANIFTLSGRSGKDAKTAADSVFKIELELAKVSLSAEDEREADRNYHKLTREQATSEIPTVDWNGYFEGMGIPGVEDFVVGQPDFMKRVGELLQTADIQDIKNYFTFMLLNTYAHTLSEDFVSASFHFNGQILEGKTEQKPLWQQTIEEMNGSIVNQAIGPLYCEQYFDNTDKARILEIVGNIKDAFGERIKDLDWMTDETKQKALDKLANVTFKMGYPDSWIDVSGIGITNDRKTGYANNNLSTTRFAVQRELNKLGKPFDRSEWRMQPTVVNASSDLKRSLTFPAAILQPPFYDKTADEAYNFGAIGMVVGHELSHFFDDQGCKFDVNGNMNNWWKDEDAKHFKEKAAQFVSHYGNYKSHGLHVNGQLTLGENIADVAGIAVAYDAYQKYLQTNPKANVVVDDMTPEQRFFAGYARLWASKITPEAALRRIKNDPHSPDPVRVNAALALTPAFYDAFDVHEGDQMYIAPDNRPKIW